MKHTLFSPLGRPPYTKRIREIAPNKFAAICKYESGAEIMGYGPTRQEATKNLNITLARRASRKI